MKSWLCRVISPFLFRILGEIRCLGIWRWTHSLVGHCVSLRVWTTHLLDSFSQLVIPCDYQNAPVSSSGLFGWVKVTPLNSHIKKKQTHSYTFKTDTGAPGWLSWLTIGLLILAQVCEIEPRIGLHADSAKPAWGFCLSLPLLLSHSLALSK